MRILLLDALVPEATQWLQERHTVQYLPELAEDLQGLQHAASAASAIVFPRQTVLTRSVLASLPQLKAIGRLHVGTDNTDLDACLDLGIRVIHSASANVRSNAEYLLGALMLLYRRGVVSAFMGNRFPTATLGRELAGSTVGLVGLAPAGHALAGILNALGVRVIGYDPAVHRTAKIWTDLGITPVSLAELVGTADAVSVQMLYAQRFKGFFNERILSLCKPGQMWVSISRSDVFDVQALARAMTAGLIGACVIDGVEPDFLGPVSPLRGMNNLAVTPRLGSHTREARLRSSWYVAQRLHEALTPPPAHDTAAWEVLLSNTMATFGESVPLAQPEPLELTQR